MLKTNASQMWINEVEPFITDTILKKCKTDSVLISVLQKLVNNVNSDIIRKENFSFRLEPIVQVLSRNTYYSSGVIKNSQNEITLVKSLNEKLSLLLKVSKYEFRSNKSVEENAPKRDRLPNDKSFDSRDLYKPKSIELQ